MSDKLSNLTIELEEFTRIFPLRSSSIMWFLGAGASAASGIKTAWNMIWDFKRTLYCSQTRTPRSSIPDFADPSIRARLQQYFDEKGGYPPNEGEDEYAFYFERAYPSPIDRRRYIEELVRAGTPSYGQLALATLLAHDKARMIWTTNFDIMVEDACYPILGSSGKLTVATLGEPEKMLQAMNEGRWPILGKIHGDFQSQRLKNTAEELRLQDEHMRYALVEGCKRFGLAVVGYSGRDRSVMNALEEAIADGHGFPHGLFWFQRTGTPVLPSVQELLIKAADGGIEARLVNVETFDELLDSVIIQIEDLPSKSLITLEQTKSRVADAPVPRPGGGWPTIRLNALPILEMPTVCRRVVCNIGGYEAVRKRLSECQVDVVATRRQTAVLAFGSDSEVRRALTPYDIREFDLHAIDVGRLRFESAELGLLYEAFCRAVQRERPLRIEHRRNGHLLIVPHQEQRQACFATLQQATSSLTGRVPRTNLFWAEAARIRLEHRFDMLWLLIEPTIWISRTGDDAIYAAGKEFTRERLARRYNRAWNDVLKGWMDIIIGTTSQATLSAFGIGDGVDATFRLSKHTAFSKRHVIMQGGGNNE